VWCRSRCKTISTCHCTNLLRQLLVDRMPVLLLTVHALEAGCLCHQDANRSGGAAWWGSHKQPGKADPPVQLTCAIPPQLRLGCYPLLQIRGAAYQGRRLEVQGLGGQGRSLAQLLQLLGPAGECGDQLAVCGKVPPCEGTSCIALSPSQCTEAGRDAGQSRPDSGYMADITPQRMRHVVGAKPVHKAVTACL
jgi:hypothetical protein